MISYAKWPGMFKTVTSSNLCLVPRHLSPVLLSCSVDYGPLLWLWGKANKQIFFFHEKVGDGSHYGPVIVIGPVLGGDRRTFSSLSSWLNSHEMLPSDRLNIRLFVLVEFLGRFPPRMMTFLYLACDLIYSSLTVGIWFQISTMTSKISPMIVISAPRLINQ